MCKQPHALPKDLRLKTLGKKEILGKCRNQLPTQPSPQSNSTRTFIQIFHKKSHFTSLCKFLPNIFNRVAVSPPGHKVINNKNITEFQLQIDSASFKDINKHQPLISRSTINYMTLLAFYLRFFGKIEHHSFLFNEVSTRDNCLNLMNKKEIFFTIISSLMDGV